MYVILHEKKKENINFLMIFFSHPIELISKQVWYKASLCLLVKSPPLFLPPNDNYEDMLFVARIYRSYEW